MILSFLYFQEVYSAKETKTFSQWVMEKLLHQNVERSNFSFEFPSISPPSPCGEFKVLYWAKKRQILSQKALIFCFDPSASLLHFVFCRPDVQHIVAANQNLKSRGFIHQTLKCCWFPNSKTNLSKVSSA